MSIVNPSILPGFMELLPQDQKVFDKMLDIIESNFKKYGFINIDTPIIEKEEILLSKGGGETSKQIYRIDKESTKQALRFDLTVSLARYIAMYSHNLNFPFRRYQIGKVYRGERNQKGRYREFYQCDIDIIGYEKLSLANDGEIPAVIYNIFKELGFSDITFRINNRKLMQGFLQSLQVEDFEQVLRTIDKLGKIGRKKTEDILIDEGLDLDKVDKIFEFIEDNKDNQASLDKLNKLDISNDAFILGRDELIQVYQYMQDFGIDKKNIKIDFTITRGLDYYTGTVYETFLNSYESIGSVCSGGRYDDLANNFTKQTFPGIGLSIGLTRLFYQLNEAGLLDKLKEDINKNILVLPMNQDQIPYAIEIVNLLRDNDFPAQVYLESGKVKKKFSYADSMGIQNVIIIGGDEVATGQVSVRDFESGKQVLISKDKLIDFLGV